MLGQTCSVGGGLSWAIVRAEQLRQSSRRRKAHLPQLWRIRRQARINGAGHGQKAESQLDVLDILD